MRNPVYEQALNKQGLKWEYVEKVPLADIDINKSFRNQARNQSLVDELVDSYEQAYKDGDQFPPLVIYRTSARSRFVLIDGNQRSTAARKAGKEDHDAYLVDCNDPRVIDRVTWTFNNMVNGKRLSKEECLDHAMSFVRKYGMTHAEAAKEWGLSRAQLQRHVKLTEINEELIKAGVKKTPLLTNDKLFSLSPLMQAGKDLFCKAAETVANYGLGSKDIEGLLKDVANATTSEDKRVTVDKLATSEEAKRRRAETKGGTINTRRNDPRDQLDRVITSGNRLFTSYDKAALKPAPEDYKTKRQEAAEFIHNLSLLFGFGAAVSDEDRKGGVA